MPNRELLMLAKTFDPDRHKIASWLVSTKYDGQRCFWDGGVSRGVRKAEVPWANTAKDERYVEEPIATGLWTRYGNVIHAPSWFLDQLPGGIFLDGELWINRGKFQATRRIVSRLEPLQSWTDIRFIVFEAPPPDLIFETGRINNLNFQKMIREVDCRTFIKKHTIKNRPQQFKYVPNFLESLNVDMAPQVQLPSVESEARQIMYDMLAKETSLGGEGLMLRNPMSYYSPRRTKYLLKVKPLDTEVGKVVGYTWGVEGKEGKLLGKMGAVRVEFRGKTFSLSGFTEKERTMISKSGSKEEADYEGRQNPGEVVDDNFYNPLFPCGNEIRFYYHGLTDDGLPREARYCRES